MSTPKTDEAAIRAIIRALRAADYTLDVVHDGEEEISVSTEPEALDAIMAVDCARLYVKRAADGGQTVGWVFFVLGNDPEEVACDYTVNLGEVIDPLTESWWN